ncbi:hypothetical protein N431DRAFT_427257 [Stipitochalara longipes BDJ]|nr:hypothetical protein N431DRAFT_427257 [Stipitochalara longipes BDJ]
MPPLTNPKSPFLDHRNNHDSHLLSPRTKKKEEKTLTNIPSAPMPPQSKFPSPSQYPSHHKTLNH